MDNIGMYYFDLAPFKPCLSRGSEKCTYYPIGF